MTAPSIEPHSGFRRLAFGLVLVVGALLRLLDLGDQSLWWDEAWQRELASAPDFPALLDRALNPQITLNPPLYHVVSWVFFRLGESDAWLRVPSAILGVLNLAVFHRLARVFLPRALREPGALLATAVMAFSPFHIHYSREARMYTLLILVAMLASLALRRLAREPASPRRIAALACALTASIFTHVHTAFGFLAQGLFVLSRARARKGSFMLAAGVALGLFVPMIFFFLERVERLTTPIGGAGGQLLSLPYAFFVYAAGLSLGPSIAELKSPDRLSAVGGEMGWIALVCVVFGGLVALGARWMLRSAPDAGGRDDAWHVLLGFAVPLTGVWLVSFLPGMTFNVRYTAWAFPFFCLLVTAGLLALAPRRALGLTASMSVLAVFAISDWNHFANDRYRKEDVRAAIAHWRADTNGEPLLSYGGSPTVERYLEGGEIDRYVPIWTGTTAAQRVASVLEEQDANDAQVLIVRDFDRSVGRRIAGAFAVTAETSFPGGVRLLRVARARAP